MRSEPQALRPADALPRSWVDAAPPEARPYLRLMRLDRPIGAWLLFWPSVFGLVLGAVTQDRPFQSWSDAGLVALFALGAIVMRGAGCTYNDIVDRDIDAKVARTRSRPIPSGAVSLRNAMLFLAAQCLAGLAILLQLNWHAVELGAASLFLIAAYPFMKRVTWWPQAWLGFTFNWGALLGFVAQSGTVKAADLLLYAGCFFWTLGYDTIYALQDIEDDVLVGVKSTARLLGQNAPRWIAIFYAVALALITTAGLAAHLGPLFLLLMLVPAAHFFWQARVLRIDRPDECLHLFRANRETGALIALAFFIASFAI